MGRRINLYVNDGELPLWERVEAHARARRLSISALVLTALEEYLDQHDPAPEKGAPTPDAP